ncbi:MAG: glycosyltransferase family 39 protein [Acidimicrobiales bacterium]
MSKHLQVLADAGLVAPDRAGREQRYHLVPTSFTDAVAWWAEVGGLWDRRLARLGARIDQPGSEPSRQPRRPDRHGSKLRRSRTVFARDGWTHSRDARGSANYCRRVRAAGPLSEPDAATEPRSTLRTWGPIGAVVVAFVGAAFVLPTLAPVAISDDFLYARSVEILRDEHTVRVLPGTAVTLVAQIGWGALFGAVFGDSLGVLRAATVTFALFGGLAMYGLCRELGVNRNRSALGAAISLFNPLSFVLSYTFMTDAYVLALLTMSLYCYLRGLRPGERGRWTVAGSVLAGIAFLFRHPGILVVVGVVTYLVASGSLDRTKASLRRLAQVALAPALMVVGYVLWFRFVHGVPERSNQIGILNAVPDAGVGGIWRLTQRVTVLGATYVGLFVLPLAAAALWCLPGLLRPFGLRRWTVLGGGIVLLAALAAGDFAPFTDRMPWAPQFLTDRGLGPIDLRGGRPEVYSSTVTTTLLVLAGLSLAVLAVALLRRTRALRQRGPEGAGPGLLAAMAFWLALSVVVLSLPLRDGAYSYDRYFLPLLPVTVALLLWALRPVPIITPLAWLGVVVMGAYAIAGTHDHLAYQEATWALAREARAGGVDEVDLDAGAAWDGYGLYEQFYEQEVTVDLDALAEAGLTGPLKLSENDAPAWWIGFYTPGVTGDYVVATAHLYTYEIVRRIEYSSWLLSEPQYMYLLRHPDADGPL